VEWIQLAHDSYRLRPVVMKTVMIPRVPAPRNSLNNVLLSRR
jgi:hypothetical protein